MVSDLNDCIIIIVWRSLVSLAFVILFQEINNEYFLLEFLNPIFVIGMKMFKIYKGRFQNASLNVITNVKNNVFLFNQNKASLHYPNV